MGREIWDLAAAAAFGWVSFDLYNVFIAPRLTSKKLRQRGIDHDIEAESESLEIWWGDTTGRLAEHLLRAEEASYGGEGGIERFDVVRVASNCPSEDEYCHGFFSSPWNGVDGKSANEANWSAFGVFDGHL